MIYCAIVATGMCSVQHKLGPTCLLSYLTSFTVTNRKKVKCVNCDKKSKQTKYLVKQLNKMFSLFVSYVLKVLMAVVQSI